jgi:hypothetical protein
MFGVIRDAGELEIYLVNAQNEPVPCALILPEQLRSWPLWKSTTTNTAIGIATTTEGRWAHKLSPGIYRLQMAFPTTISEQEVVIYPWWKTTLHIQSPLERIEPSLSTCKSVT